MTVAKSFDGPIKLLFPRVLSTLETKGQFSLLGLGDIVIPGLFVAILLRFDAVRAKIRVLKDVDHAVFPRPYFTINIIFYALGLVTTVLIMYFFNAAQPALLYLVPACLGSSLLTAVIRGEITALFAYDEEVAKDSSANVAKDAKAVEKGEDKKVK